MKRGFTYSIKACLHIQGFLKGTFLLAAFLFAFQLKVQATCNANFTYRVITNTDSVRFLASVTNATGYSWNFGDGTSASTADPLHVYTQPGKYRVCLTVKDSGTYCDFCDTIVVTGPTLCNAQFIHYRLGSNADSVHFYPSATNGLTYSWTFGDGTTSTNADPWHVYSKTGIYQACLTVSVLGRDTCTFCDTVAIFPPTACNARFLHYSLNSHSDSVHFYPAATNAAVYYWSFGDGTRSTLADLWHVYTTAGTYYVCLTVKDSGTYCVFCDSVKVTGSAPPCNAKFVHYPSTANRDSIHFGATAAAGAYYWSFGDGTTATARDPWHLYKTPGTYRVCLYVRDSGTYCDWCDTITVAAATACNAKFVYYHLTNYPDSLRFGAHAGATAYYWSFGDGTNSTNQYPLHYYKTAGTYYVCLSVNDSGTYCTWCDTIAIANSAPCNARFIHYALSTNADSIHFYPVTANATSYYWTFGDGTTSTNSDPWHVYKASGTYLVCLTVDVSGTICDLCDTVIVKGSTPCNAKFVHYALAHSDSVHFGAAAGATAYYWSFGDGTSSTLQDPWHLYKVAGTYYACLYVNDSGTYCNSCDTIVIAGSTPCIARFSHYSASNPDSVHFYPAATNGTTYYWSFGDGTSSSDATPWHLYKPGTYYPCLTVNVAGTYCTTCDTIVIKGTTICNAEFRHYARVNTDSVYFYPQTTNATGYYWNFGDGTRSTDKTIWHIYSQPGTYYACLYVNDSGTYCEHCDTIVVTGIPVICNAKYSYYQRNTSDTVQFYPASTAATSYYWNFSDGTTSTNPTLNHVFSNPGSYRVCLYVNDSGTYCDWCDTVVVKGTVPCNARFSHYYISNPDSVHFYPATTGATSYSWNFGDGTSSTNATPWHKYTAAGTFYACLTVNVSGTSCTSCDTVVIAGQVQCNAAFSHYTLSGTDSVHFYPRLTTANTYYWSFGDGTTSTNLDPWHVYNQPGTYYACLSVNDSGTTCTTCDTVIVEANVPLCNARFSHYNVGRTDSIHFYPAATNASSYYWSFGDGTISTNTDPWHVYKQPGTYSVCLYVADSGTSCTWCDTIVVTGTTVCNAEFKHYVVTGQPDSIVFYPVNTKAATYYWSFGDGATSTTPTPMHVYNPGTYHVCLYVNDSGTYCDWCDTVVVTGGAPPCSAHFLFRLSTVADSVYFFPVNTNATSYYWSFGDGNYSTDPNPWHQYTAPGTYLACLAVNDSGSYCDWCDTIIIQGQHPCDAGFGHYSLSDPDSVHFYPTGPKALSYSWTFSDGGTSTDQDPWHVFTQPGIYYACLTVNDSGGYCTWCDTVTIGGVTPCNAQFSDYASSRNVDSIYFHGTGATATSYYWSFGDGKTSTDTNPWHQYEASGTYYVCLAVNDSGAYCIWCDSVVVLKSTGIPVVEASQLDVMVYPNPMNDHTIISIRKTSNLVSIQIFDLTGRQVYSMANIRDGIYNITTKNLPQGLYYFNVIDSDKQVVAGGKLVVAH